MTEPAAWRMSFHGGHSGEFCEHAAGRLEELVVAAIDAGMRAFGISEHMPPSRPEDRYTDEVAAGLEVSLMQERFRRYATETVPDLQARYGDRIALLLGMETEVLPPGRYPEVVQQMREQLGLQYVVGSVHHIDGQCFDMSPAGYHGLVERVGGLDALYLAYYEAQRQMLEALRPEVVGHFDLIRKFAPPEHRPSEAVREAASRNLELVAGQGGVLEVNARAFGRWPEPYPGREQLTEALRLGIPVTFGDDSHQPVEVGGGLDRCREILLEVGYREVVRLGPGGEKSPVAL